MLREPVKVSGMRFHQHRLPIGECVTILHEPMRMPVQTFCV